MSLGCCFPSSCDRICKRLTWERDIELTKTTVSWQGRLFLPHDSPWFWYNVWVKDRTVSLSMEGERLERMLELSLSRREKQYCFLLRPDPAVSSLPASTHVCFFFFWFSLWKNLYQTQESVFPAILQVKGTICIETQELSASAHETCVETTTRLSWRECRKVIEVMLYFHRHQSMTKSQIKPTVNFQVINSMTVESTPP